MQTPLRRVLHFGAAHDGTATFWRQRVTGAANAVLVVFFVGVLIATVGRPYEQIVGVLGSPVVAALFALFVVSAAVHMRIGMQTIIEDYVHGQPLKTACLIANTFFAFAVAAVGLIAIVKLSLGVAGHG